MADACERAQQAGTDTFFLSMYPLIAAFRENDNAGGRSGNP